MTVGAGLEVLARAVGAHLRERSGATPPSAACLSDEVLAQLGDGAMAPGVATAAIAHLAGCATCRADLAEVMRAVRDPRVVRALPSHVAARRWFVRVAVPLAAAASLLLILGPSLRHVGGPPHRERGVLSAPAPVALAPIGPVSSARTLTWYGVPGADRYRLTLFAGDSVLYDVELLDTLAALPDRVRLRAGPTYLWKVEARVGFDRWVSSDLVRFSLVPGLRR